MEPLVKNLHQKKKKFWEINFISFLQNVLIDKDKNYIIHNLSIEIKKMQDGTSNKIKHLMASTILGTNSHLMYISLTIEGLKDDGRDDITNLVKSFSVIIIDQTTEHFQEELAESEKTQREQLISSFIPPSIAKRQKD
ncbi:hypothetical protein TRFO_09267 [Tritrichomonas foetus]|uniref:Uncharacterized protein n=1 Tax=Tritrichomonas foetus TaxID=1144522 RepID=A0A1J4JFB7_9EUKA|nr:hypothetical protein TRFO_09267 [Tritrichomonas foetus]|eukprot:OHS97834.1 hypothetical protein TRFO_09267 [Tritrichomonas foetus]